MVFLRLQNDKTICNKIGLKLISLKSVSKSKLNNQFNNKN